MHVLRISAGIECLLRDKIEDMNFTYTQFVRVTALLTLLGILALLFIDKGELACPSVHTNMHKRISFIGVGQECQTVLWGDSRKYNSLITGGLHLPGEYCVSSIIGRTRL